MKARKPTMTVQRLRYLCAEIYRKVNCLNPNYMKNVFKKSVTLRSKRTQHTNIISLYPDQIIKNLEQKVLLLLGQKFGILFPLILRPQKHLKCLKNSSKHGMEKCLSAVCAHIIRIIKSCENKSPKNRSYYHNKVDIF